MGNSCSPGCRWWCLWWRLFVLSFFQLDVLDEIWDVIESVSEGFLTYFCNLAITGTFPSNTIPTRGLLVLKLIWVHSSSAQYGLWLRWAKILGPSCKINLDFWDCFVREKSAPVTEWILFFFLHSSQVYHGLTSHTWNVWYENSRNCNSLDPNEAAHNEPPHQDLHCLPSSLWILNMIKAWTKFCRLFFLALNRVNGRERGVFKL